MLDMDGLALHAKRVGLSFRSLQATLGGFPCMAF